MDLYRFFVPRRLSIRWVREAFAAHDVILVDANLPEETIAAIVAKARSLAKPVAAIAISPAKVVRLKPCIEDIDYLFLNEAEAAALVGQQPQDPAGWPPLLKAIGISSAVVTRGRRELVAICEDRVVTLEPPLADTVADVTGAGDSLAAGTLAALLSGLPLEEAVRHGAAAAALTVQSRHAVNENLTPDTLNAALALVPGVRILH